MSEMEILDNNSDLDKKFLSSQRTTRKTSFIMGLFMKLGFKNEKQATFGMVIVILVCVFASIFIISSNSKGPNFKPPAGERFYKEDLTQEDINKLPPGMIDNLPSKYAK